jgi:hypothetical protein
MVGTSPTMTASVVFMGSGLGPADRPGMTTWFRSYQPSDIVSGGFTSGGSGEV